MSISTPVIVLLFVSFGRTHSVSSFLKKSYFLSVPVRTPESFPCPILCLSISGSHFQIAYWFPIHNLLVPTIWFPVNHLLVPLHWLSSISSSQVFTGPAWFQCIYYFTNYWFLFLLSWSSFPVHQLKSLVQLI